MYSQTEKVMIGALLHDVGKLCGRASGSRKKHSDEGAEFLRVQLQDKEEWESIIESVEYHHEDALKKASLPDDHIAYIICEADNISAGLDRRVIEQEGSMLWDKNAALKSVFNLLDGKKKANEKSYELQTLKKDNAIYYPKEVNELTVSQQRYQYIMEDFEKGFTSFVKDDMSVNSLLRLTELSYHSIPSSTDTSQQTDVSLYQHSKTTAMLASAMYQYFLEKETLNFKEECLIKKNKLRDNQLFLLVGADVSGIQNFIYSVSSKGALKSLRGRSFYLEVLVEHIIDEILDALELSRTNLIYSGGGHLYLLLPNTEKAKSTLTVAESKINQWLFDRYGVNLYIQFGSNEITANQLANQLNEKYKTENDLGNAYQELSSKISKGKLKRYSNDFLKEIMVNKTENQLDFGGRECSVCGKADDSLFVFDGTDICKECYGLYQLGDFIPRTYHKEKMLFLAVYNTPLGFKGELELPSLSGETKFLAVKEINDVENMIASDPMTRFYSINNDVFGYNFANNIWVGSYNAKNEYDQNQLIDLSSLQNKSRGIKRLAMLKADVDNLGSLFKNAFINLEDKNPYQFVSISRNTSLSYLLSMFFRYEINKVCEQSSEKSFSLLPDQPSPVGYQLVIIYSGGDDVLVVGAWDQVLEFAVNLNRAFEKYTMSKITMSAGLGLFSDGFPINQMSRITEKLEKEAKESGKDSISLFGEETYPDKQKDKLFVQNHIYSWQDFEDKVYKDKFSKLYQWFDIADQDDRKKIPFGRTAFYRLLQYVTELSNGDSGKINIAKIAYVIARMEPENKRLLSCKDNFEDFKTTFFYWIKNNEDVKQLITAMTLIIYLNRKE